MNKFRAEWTGEPPRPYLGAWVVTKNGTDITHFLPTDRQAAPAFTYGEYPVWEEHPHASVQQFVTDGDEAPEWIAKNMHWLQLMADTDADYLQIYLAFHENDFRSSRYYAVEDPEPFHPAPDVLEAVQQENARFDDFEHMFEPPTSSVDDASNNDVDYMSDRLADAPFGAPCTTDLPFIFES